MFHVIDNSDFVITFDMIFHFTKLSLYPLKLFLIFRMNDKYSISTSTYKMIYVKVWLQEVMQGMDNIKY